jgi:hypothetical protein
MFGPGSVHCQDLTGNQDFNPARYTVAWQSGLQSRLLKFYSQDSWQS